MKRLSFVQAPSLVLSMLIFTGCHREIALEESRDQNINQPKSSSLAVGTKLQLLVDCKYAPVESDRGRLRCQPPPTSGLEVLREAVDKFGSIDSIPHAFIADAVERSQKSVSDLNTGFDSGLLEAGSIVKVEQIVLTRRGDSTDRTYYVTVTSGSAYGKRLEIDPLTDKGYRVDQGHYNANPMVLKVVR